MVRVGREPDQPVGSHLADEALHRLAGEAHVAGDVGDGETVALSTGPAGLTINGKAVAKGEAANDEPEVGSVVPFPKGADSLH